MSEGEDQIESDCARVFTPQSPSGVTALVLGGDVKLSLADLSLSERLAADGALVLQRLAEA